MIHETMSQMITWVSHSFNSSAPGRWCHQATSHYLSQWWPRYMSPYAITSPQCVKYGMQLLTHALNACWFSRTLTVKETPILHWPLAVCVINYDNICPAIKCWMVTLALDSLTDRWPVWSGLCLWQYGLSINAFINTLRPEYLLSDILLMRIQIHFIEHVEWIIVCLDLYFIEFYSLGFK